MKMCTVEELQKNLQVLANQVGSKRFTTAKNLMLEGLVIVDADGNPVDPANIKYEVMLSPAEAVAEEAAVEATDAVVEEPKALADEVAKAVKLELSSVAVTHPITTRKESPVIQHKRYGVLKHFKTEERAYAFGSWALACLGYTKSAEFCKNNGILVTKANNMETSNSTGGFLVPEQMEQDLVTLREQFGVARKHCRIVPMTSDLVRIPRRASNLTAYFIGEGGTGTASNEVFDSLTLSAKKSMVLTKFSSELSEDAVIDFAQDLASEMAYSQTKLEDDCLFNGDGTNGSYGGIVGIINAIGTGTGGGTVTATSTAYGAITVASIAKLFAQLPQYADNANTKIFCNKSVWANTFQRLAYASGGNNANDLLTGSGQLQYAGYPVVITQAITATTFASGVPFAWFGDMSQAAYFGDRRITQVDFSNSALTSFETDMLCYRATTRWDINVANVGTATTSGSMVQLVPGA